MKFIINEEDILGRIKDHLGTKEGKELINNNVKVDSDMMLEAARMFRQTLVAVMEMAAPFSIPYSLVNIARSSEDFYVSTPTKWVDEDGDGINEWMVSLTFSEQAVKRKSLAIKGKTFHDNGDVIGYSGEGINNIISLFDTGYPLEKERTEPAVYGWWLSKNKYVAAVRARAGLDFIQHSVDRFNEMYSKEYGCYATISEDCEYYVKKWGKKD